MTSIFYNRYIPPSAKGKDVLREERPTKRRKKTASSAVVSPKQPNVHTKPKKDAAVPASASPKDLYPKPDDAEPDDQDLPLRNRHQSVYSKYEKAKKQAAETSIGAAPFKNKKNTVPEHPTEVESHGLEPLPQPTQVIEPHKVSLSSALPEWLRSPTLVSSTDAVPFEDLPIDREIVSLLQARGFEKAFAIQSAMLPMLLPGPRHYCGDLCVSAATGSGKTLAYTLPIVESLRGRSFPRLRGLIVVPTRELVNQVKETLESVTGGSAIVVGTAVGSKTLKEEQVSLVARDQIYNPDGYEYEQKRMLDEDEELMDWDLDKRFEPTDDFDVLYNHVVQYNSKVDILICTPGRLVEHIQSTTGFTVEHVKWLVIDEADRLLDESFQQWVDVLLPALEYLPPLDSIQERLGTASHLLRRREVRKIILSATMTRDVSKLSALRLRRPRLVILEEQGQKGMGKVDDVAATKRGDRIELPTTLQEIGFKVTDTNEKPLYLIKLLESDLGTKYTSLKSDNDGKIESEPSDEESSSFDESDGSSASSNNMLSPRPNITRAKPSKHTAQQPATHGTLIFTKTNEHASRLARLLSLLRPTWASQLITLTKSTTSSRGLKTLSAFRRRKLSILIASDRASRGLDISNLAHVINYDMPSSLTSYIHRVGRTARAGMEGKATTLIADNEARWFWNEVARSEKVTRGPGKKVQRVNMKLDLSDEEREGYEQALRTLGEETRGVREEGRE